MVVNGKQQAQFLSLSLSLSLRSLGHHLNAEWQQTHQTGIACNHVGHTAGHAEAVPESWSWDAHMHSEVFELHAALQGGGFLLLHIGPAGLSI